jgi:hypothetical protein
MKVRWMSGSLRLRITPTELALLAQDETVTEALGLPGGWRIVLRPGAAQTRLCSQSALVELALAGSDLRRLMEPDTEGVYFQQDGFRYFVEKDFPCAHPRPKEVTESTEHFAPPEGFAARHQCPI